MQTAKGVSTPMRRVVVVIQAILMWLNLKVFVEQTTGVLKHEGVYDKLDHLPILKVPFVSMSITNIT